MEMEKAVTILCKKCHKMVSYREMRIRRVGDKTFFYHPEHVPKA